MPTFEEIKAKCLRDNKLFEDLEFPARNTSINPGRDDPEDWLWRRPMEISDDEPVFAVEGASRFDLVQGDLGDCWFIATCAALATRKELFSRVVPSDQEFKSNYAGIFKFNFWRFGEWREVYVDDRLPVTVDNNLRFGQNRSQPNEFWGALLEKAYAKLEGSYAAIQRGHVKNALVDMTGGISEEFNLIREEKLPPDLFEIIKKSHEMDSLMACGIWGDPGSMSEELMWNGLYKGHAYTITAVLETRIRGWHVQLLRLRNPWGEKEWNGTWSDDSDEWLSLSDADKREIGLIFDEDGEFWIGFHDFLSNFHGLDIVHVDTETNTRVHDGSSNNVPTRQWQESSCQGRWINGINAGGSGYLAETNTRLYYTNPQYYFKLKDPDEDDVGGDCTCVISLLQKDYSKRKVQRGATPLIIGFDVHMLKISTDEPLSSETYFERAQLKKQFHTRTPQREVSCRLQLNPGTYCVIPNTMRPHREGEFMLRIFTYTKIVFGPLDEEVLTSQYKKVPQTTSRPVSTFSNDMFVAFAADEHVIDARDLRDLLSDLARKEFGESVSFGIESCRTLIAMLDKDGSGVLDYEETVHLWEEVCFWRKIFKKYDRDKSGCIETYELRNIFKEIGYTLKIDTISCLAVRYGGKDRSLFFEDFTICLARTVTLHAVFNKYSENTPGQASMNLDEWLGSMLFM